MNTIKNSPAPALISFVLIIGFSISRVSAQWTRINTSPSYVISMTASHDTLFAITSGGQGYYCYSADKGQSWIFPAVSGLETVAPMQGNTICRDGKGNIYFTDDAMGVFKSSDLGVTWTSDSTGLLKDFFDHTKFNHYNYIFTSGNRVTANTTSVAELYGKEINANAWSYVNSWQAGSVIMHHIKVGAIVFAVPRWIGGHSYPAVRFSKDDGLGWQKGSNAGFDTTGSAGGTGIASDGESLIVSSNNGLFRSTDWGCNWARIDHGFPVYSNAGQYAGKTKVAAVFSDGACIIASVKTNIDSLKTKTCFRSTDKGATWTNITSGLPFIPTRFVSMGSDLYGFRQEGDLDSSVVVYSGIVNASFDLSSITPVSDCITGTCTVVPTGLTTSAITATSVTLSWISSSGAVSYAGRYKASSSGTWIIFNSSSASYSLTNLTPSTAYDFQIETACSSGTSDFSPTSTFTTAAASTSGIMRNENNIKLDLFPNPATEVVTLKYNSINQTKARFYLSDISGRVLFTSDLKYNEQNITIDLTALENGVYFYKAVDGENKDLAVGKLVVVK